MSSLFAPIFTAVFDLAGGRPIFPADVAPPVPVIVGIGAVGLVAIGLFIAAVVLASVFVLRRIRRDSSSAQDESPGQDE